MTLRISHLAAVLLLAGCGKDWEPGVKTIESLAPVMKQNRADCMMLPKSFGEEANKSSDALMKMPTVHADSFKDDAKAIKEKFGSRLEVPCTEIVDGAKQCRADGAPNISGFGQQVIDICKVVKGVSGKL